MWYFYQRNGEQWGNGYYRSVAMTEDEQAENNVTMYGPFGSETEARWYVDSK